MGYVREYGIFCVVMYDESFDENNLMFDLNRVFIQEEKDIVIIN